MSFGCDEVERWKIAPVADGVTRQQAVPAPIGMSADQKIRKCPLALTACPPI